MDDRRLRFEKQVLPHLDAAYNLARWLARGDADDIVQDAFLRAFRGFDGFRGDDAKPWLLAIVRNCWRDAGSAQNRRGRLEQQDDERMALVADKGDPEIVAIAGGESRRLDALIAGLPEEYREVFVLREMEEMNYREIAEAIDVPIGTVMSRLARARALLKARWMAGETV
jgi:RNA polymerase sigma-70 factor (ECF subfamily)